MSTTDFVNGLEPGVAAAALLVTAAIALGAAAAVAWLCLRVRRAERELASIRAALAETAGVAGSVRVAERTSREQLARLLDRLGRLELLSDARGYEQAIRFAARGERAERLVSYFGLTEGEAALVSLLHDRSREAREERRPPSAS